MNINQLVSKSKTVSFSNYKIHGGIFPKENKSISSTLGSQINFFKTAEQFNPSKNNLEAITCWEKQPKEKLLERIKQAGIVGLGGACFPTEIKLLHRKNINEQPLPIDTLIINAMECEPYITCDDVLIQHYSDEILQGALMVARILDVKNILFGIEDNKLDAIEKLDATVERFNQHYNNPLNINIIVTPTMYPSGGEKQIIQLLTGKQVPQQQYPSSLGIVVQNIATIFAVEQAIVKGKPLSGKLVTITGNLVNQPANYWLDFGTKLSDIIEHFVDDTTLLEKVILGGPMMGKSTGDFEQVTDASVNCIIFNKQEQQQNAIHAPCIRCAECETVCPVSLLPQQLFWFSQAEQWQQAENQSLFDCIECGACDYVCPSEIPLVNYFKFAKSQIQLAKEKSIQSEIAKQRFDNRAKRLQRIKQQRLDKRQKNDEIRKKASANSQKDPDGKKSAIEAALERVKMKKDNNEL